MPAGSWVCLYFHLQHWFSLADRWAINTLASQLVYILSDNKFHWVTTMQMRISMTIVNIKSNQIWEHKQPLKMHEKKAVLRLKMVRPNFFEKTRIVNEREKHDFHMQKQSVKLYVCFLNWLHQQLSVTGASSVGHSVHQTWLTLNLAAILLYCWNEDKSQTKLMIEDTIICWSSDEMMHSA